MSVSDQSTIAMEGQAEKENHQIQPPGPTERQMGVSGPELAGENLEGGHPKRADGKIELTEEDCYDKLGYCFPAWKKWMILVIILLIQTSMNLNASIYANGVDGLAEKYTISKQKARVGQMIFLICYAFGCELWAPWSEELGRWPTQQLSLFLVNIWQLPAALAPNFGSIVVARALAGLSTAGGSVTLGVIADLYQPEDSGFQYAVAFVVLSSVGGAPVGAVIGGFVGQYLSLPWIFWMQLCIGGAVQIIHFFLVPETRATILLDREAKRRRKNGETNIYGPDELKKPRFPMKEFARIWMRPFQMFVMEPIVLCLSLLSGFSDALLFTFLEAFTPVFKQWGFKPYQVGLAFISSLVGYVLAYLTYLPVIRHHNKIRADDPNKLSPESRLWWLLFLAPLETIGLFGFAWTSLGPDYGIPWIAPLIFTVLIAMANYGIYKSSIDYMIAAYGPYAASATGGNDLARDFLAGVAALYSTPFYENISKKYTLEYPSTILACLSVVVIIPIYVFYWKGEWFRDRSKFAKELNLGRQGAVERRRSTMYMGKGSQGIGGEKARHVEQV
ncbi:putative MFS multidrug transporter [Fonsecaea pedrosoi]|nr:putative MFS multidrug transporter [Fonsecaea pedrosoi]